MLLTDSDISKYIKSNLQGIKPDTQEKKSGYSFVIDNFSITSHKDGYVLKYVIIKDSNLLQAQISIFIVNYRFVIGSKPTFLYHHTSTLSQSFPCTLVHCLLNCADSTLRKDSKSRLVSISIGKKSSKKKKL